MWFLGPCEEFLLDYDDLVMNAPGLAPVPKEVR